MKFLVLLLLTSSAWASFPELFGPSAGSIAQGNLPEEDSAANNYHAGALLGYSRKSQFSFNTFYVATAFKDINDVVVRNETNTVNQLESSDVETNPTPSTLVAAHLSLPLFVPEGPKFNLSLIAPVDRLLEADTGDPYQPSYVMYANRYLRPSIHLSLAKDFGEWSYSLGAMTGFQSNGETYVITRTSAGNPSLAKISFNAKPSLGATASVARKTNGHTTYFAFQQEMKSKFVNRATGETEIGGGASFPFDFKVNSLLFFDPLTLRLGQQEKFDWGLLNLGLEFQQWDRYEPATIRIKKQGGDINGSEDYEKLKPKNIFIPKIAVEKKMSERWSLKTGYFYRPSPLRPTRLKHAGNSIDLDKHVVGLGTAHVWKIYNVDVVFDFAYQGHFLRQYKVVKTAGQEDGSGSDPKIGSPGYRVGGMIHVLTAGMTWKY